MSPSLFHSLPSGATRKKPALDMVAVRKIQPVGKRRSSLMMDVRPAPLSHRESDKKTVPKNAKQTFLLACFRVWHIFVFATRGAFYRGRRYFSQTGAFLKHITADTDPRKMVYLSIASGIAFGMVSMAFISHSFGGGVFARSETPVTQVKAETEIMWMRLSWKVEGNRRNLEVQGLSVDLIQRSRQTWERERASASFFSFSLLFLSGGNDDCFFS